MNYKRKILLGGSLLVGSWLVVVLMFLRIIPLSFVLSFVAYTAAVCGLFVGLIGIFEYIRIQRQRREKDEPGDENF